jgi:nicotinamidase/pyrazinamidase
MDGTPGQRKIDETAPRNPMYIENRELEDSTIEQAIAHRGELLIEKQRFDVFTGNRSAERLLYRVLKDYDDVIVYGVFTEVCVNDAVNGLARLGPQIHVVSDAIADIGPDAESFRRKWLAAGVRLLTLAELDDQLVPRLAVHPAH